MGCNALNGVADLVPVGDLPGDGGAEPADAGAESDATIAPLDSGPAPDGARPDTGAPLDASLPPIDAGAACTGLTILLRFDKDLKSAEGQSPATSGFYSYAAGQFGSGLVMNKGGGSDLSYAAVPVAGAAPVVSAAAGTVTMWVKSSWAFPCVQARTVCALVDDVGPT